jgi:hypothetical protein
MIHKSCWFMKNKKEFFMQKVIYILLLLMSLLIIPSCAADSVNVFQPLLFSPKSHSVYVGENVTVRFDKLGGAGKCDWIFTDLEVIEKKDNYVLVRPRTDVEVGTNYKVLCRDQNGDIAEADIIVVSN